MATMQGGVAAPDDAGAGVDALLDDVAATAAATPPTVVAARKGAARQAKAAAALPVMATAVPAEPTLTQEPAAVAGPATIKKKVTSHMDTMMKTAEDFMAFGQGNMEAFMRSGQIWAAGVQDLGKQFVATAQAQIDETVSTFKAMTSVKSLKEAIELQSTFARNSLDKTVAETGKITDASLKLAEQTLAPITARVSLAVEKFSRTV